MQIKSTAFTNNTVIPDRFTCKGENARPPLVIVAAPAATRSFVVWMHDPDAPAGDFTHWIVWNIPASATEITDTTLPPGAIEGQCDFGHTGYGGPCPPRDTGIHHYLFELFALNSRLSLAPGSVARHVRSLLRPRIIAHATLTGIVGA